MKFGVTAINKSKVIPIGKILIIFFAVFLIYIILSCAIPPAFFRSADGIELSDFKSEPATGERILCIDDNVDALVYRLAAIESAGESIILSTFDLADDDSGRAIMSALLEAADRGVRVDMIVDGINGEFKLIGNECFEALVSHENVKACLYNRINILLPGFVNYRLHDKYLLVDGGLYILGGRNTRDLFLGEYPEEYSIDRDVLVLSDADSESSSAAALKAYFDKIRAEDRNWEFTVCLSESRLAKGKSALRAHYAATRKKYPQAFQTVDWEAVTVPAEGVSLLWGDTRCGNKSPILLENIMALADGAEDIVIQTPYVVCNDKMYGDLASLSGDARVRILTNATESGDNVFGCVDYLNEKSKILDTGCEIFEYAGEQSLHTKTVLIDDSISIVGSYNFDMRSTYLDTELMLVINSRELNAELRSKVGLLEDSSLHVTPEGETEGANYVPCEPPFFKKLLYGILRVLVIPFRQLL